MPYRGLVGAYAFAIRRSRSWLLRGYAAVSALVGVYVAVLLALAVVTWAGNPVAFGEKALLGVLGIFILVPLFAPVMIVARRHRLGRDDRRADALLAAAGFGFLLSLLLALLITDPSTPTGSGPAVELAIAVNRAPSATGLLLPVIALLLIATAWHATRTDGSDGSRG